MYEGIMPDPPEIASWETICLFCNLVHHNDYVCFEMTEGIAE